MLDRTGPRAVRTNYGITGIRPEISAVEQEEVPTDRVPL